MRNANRLSTKRIFWGIIFGLAFVGAAVFFQDRYDDWRMYLVQVLELFLAVLCVSCFVPKKYRTESAYAQIQTTETKRPEQLIITAVTVLIAVPLTIYVGLWYLGDRKYYFISLLIILEIMVPFFIGVNKKREQVRLLLIISVLSAIAVVGRAAFYMLPQFKPVIAVVIIAGVCFGGEAGFLVGAVSAFVSDFFFGQGPWTPWQMFSFGIIGFVAGVFLRKGLLRKTRMSLSIFGGIAAVVLYGGIMNPASVLMWQSEPSLAAFISAYIMGLPFDLIHAAATVFFLWFAAEPMMEKLDRIKIKYRLK